MGSEVSTNGDVYSFGILLFEMFTGKRPTDYMFSDGLNLHNFVKTALLKGAVEIADPLVIQEDITNADDTPNRSNARAQKMEECLILIFEIGIACSAESPMNRKDINNALSELHSIRKSLLG
jgi:serine/threonine protein kinase